MNKLFLGPNELWTGAPRSPEFPVKLGGVGALHAAFLTESRTRGCVQGSVQEIRVARAYVGRKRRAKPIDRFYWLSESIRRIHNPPTYAARQKTVSAVILGR